MSLNGLIHGNPVPKKGNYTAVVAPGVGDDVGDGYSVGSVWIDLATDTVYTCTDSTSGAAKWASLGSTSAPDVTATANLTDLAVVIGDGGAKGVKSTALTINASDQTTKAWSDLPLVLDLTGATTDFTSTARNQFYGVLSIATTELQIPTGIAAGQYWSMSIQQIAAGSCALTFVASYDWGALGAPDFNSLPAGESAEIFCRVLPDGATIESSCSLNSVVTPGADNYLARYDGDDQVQPSILAVSDLGEVSVVGDLAVAPSTGIMTVGGNGVVTGAAGAACHIRVFELLITGVADATQVTAEIVASDYNSETIAIETVDSDTPTGGTRFDISADGLGLTIKGLSHTAVVVLGVTSLHNDIVGAQVYTADTSVVAGKIVIHFHNAGTNADLDLTGLGVGELLYAKISYLTSD